jgi:vacuolar iron transporter family protein
MTKKHFKSGFGFGIASGVITTLGLMVGLFSSTNSKGIVLSGIFTIAIADSFSDALGMHFSEESEGVHTNREIWEATLFTLLSKFVMTISFVPMFFLMAIKAAIISNIIWGFFILSFFSYLVAKRQKNNPLQAISEHALIMLFVITVTYYIGRLIDKFFINGF